MFIYDFDFILQVVNYFRYMYCIFFKNLCVLKYEGDYVLKGEGVCYYMFL